MVGMEWEELDSVMDVHMYDPAVGVAVTHLNHLMKNYDKTVVLFEPTKGVP